jgi:hypothetical protein
LLEIKNLFNETIQPFFAGIGNRDNDAIAYRMLGIPFENIFNGLQPLTGSAKDLAPHLIFTLSGKSLLIYSFRSVDSLPINQTLDPEVFDPLTDVKVPIVSTQGPFAVIATFLIKYVSDVSADVIF